MELIKRILPYIGIIVGLIGILLNISSISYKSCEFANSNTDFVKKQVELALESKDFKMVKYFVYKAIRGIDNSLHNFNDCGCDTAKTGIEKARLELRNAVEKEDLTSSKPLVSEALNHLIIVLRALEDYELKLAEQPSTALKTANPFKNIMSADPELMERMKKNLENYANSVEKVLENVECKEAKRFFLQVIESTQRDIRNKQLDESLRYYQKGVKEITENALAKLDLCIEQ